MKRSLPSAKVQVLIYTLAIKNGLTLMVLLADHVIIQKGAKSIAVELIEHYKF